MGTNMQDAIAARVDERSAWVDEQERRIEAAWDSLAPSVQRQIRERFLAPGERAPADLPMPVVERMLLHKQGRGLDPEPKPSEEFMKALDKMRTPKDPVSFDLGSDTYMPEALKVLQVGGRYRAVRITG